MIKLLKYALFLFLLISTILLSVRLADGYRNFNTNCLKNLISGIWQCSVNLYIEEANTGSNSFAEINDINDSINFVVRYTTAKKVNPFKVRLIERVNFEFQNYKEHESKSIIFTYDLVVINLGYYIVDNMNGHFHNPLGVLIIDLFLILIFGFLFLKISSYLCGAKI